MTTEIDWTKVGSGDDAILIDGFARDLDGEFPPGTVYLYEIGHGERCEDRAGNRFRVMGHGSVQGSVVVRDRYGRMYMTDVLVRVRGVGD